MAESLEVKPSSSTRCSYAIAQYPACAAIGIANIMVMSFMKNKEIGIMKVIVLRIKDIRRMFI